jgi:ssDNA-binding Zn-finger/Zn-ribbon topoisomerase 1
MEPADNLQCPACGAPMRLLYSKRGTFLGCSRYPACKTMRRLSSQEAFEIEGMPRLPKEGNKGTQLFPSSD